MQDLIKALMIFAKYTNDEHPTNCIHDELGVMVDPAVVSAEDRAELERLGFNASKDGYFYSFRFGSA